MALKHYAFAVIASFALAGCGSPQAAAPAEADSEVNDFAARINGTKAPTATNTKPVAPTVAQPLPNAAPGPFAPGTATDPASASCDANAMGRFLGRLADDTTRANIAAMATPGREIRYVSPGAMDVPPTVGSTRLNLMLDVQGIIRDARCG